jgi:hypothetical protein
MHISHAIQKELKSSLIGQHHGNKKSMDFENHQNLLDFNVILAKKILFEY